MFSVNVLGKRGTGQDRAVGAEGAEPQSACKAIPSSVGIL